MQLHYILGYHSGINNLQFFLFYENTLFGNWLQAYRQNAGVSFSQSQDVEDDSSR